MAKQLDYNALGQVLDTTWGRASTSKSTATYSVKANLVAEGRIRLIYTTIVNLTTDKDAILMKRHYSEESDDMLKEAVKKIKADYKDITGESVSFDEISSDTSLEMINFNHFNAKRQAYFRRIMFLEAK